MSEPIEVDDILDKILLLEKIDKGIEESENGMVISDEALDKRIESWLV